MISPNLHAIWVFFFLNLSQDLKLVLLMYLGTLGDGKFIVGQYKKVFVAQYIYGTIIDYYLTLMNGLELGWEYAA